MNISAVLLAGGESRRMGTDKATLLFSGEPLWQVQLGLLRKLEPAEILISARNDPVWRPPDVQFVSDNAPSRGPLSGISAALAKLQTSHLLALGIDMPFMTPSYLQVLLEERTSGCGVIPMIDKRAEPLAAIYPSEALAYFVAALSGADFSLQNVIKQLASAGKVRVIRVRKEDEKLFRNLNQPANVVGP